MSEISHHYCDRANPDLPHTNAELRELIAAHEFENARLIGSTMTALELARVDEKGQTVLHLLAVHPECEEGRNLMQVLASHMATRDIVLKDVNGQRAADLAFYAGHTAYKRILQTYHVFSLHDAQGQPAVSQLVSGLDPVPA